MQKIQPFANESDSLEIAGLTIENRIDRISVYGSLEVTRDKEGLRKAHEIVNILKSIVERLESEDLPDSVGPPKATDTIDNPF
jgi:hypothetical protein